MGLRVTTPHYNQFPRLYFYGSRLWIAYFNTVSRTIDDINSPVSRSVFKNISLFNHIEQ